MFSDKFKEHMTSSHLASRGRSKKFPLILFWSACMFVWFSQFPFCFSDGEAESAGNGRAVRRNWRPERRTSLSCCNACNGQTGGWSCWPAECRGINRRGNFENCCAGLHGRVFLLLLLLFSFCLCVYVCACLPPLVLLLVGLCNQVAKTENSWKNLKTYSTQIASGASDGWVRQRVLAIPEHKCEKKPDNTN